MELRIGGIFYGYYATNYYGGLCIKHIKILTFASINSYTIMEVTSVIYSEYLIINLIEILYIFILWGIYYLND